jgi:transaldolase/glucose-6-phosphate isomerase
VWLDDLRASLFSSGKLARLITEDGLRGVTSNPAIFEKAIAHSADYLAAIREFAHSGSMDSLELYETLAIHDIRTAADLLRAVYDDTQRADGYASIEVSPFLAHDTNATIDEARRLWRAVGRENVMIKVPASEEGLPAIRQLTSEGINVNITLLFSAERYEEVAWAYIEGLNAFVEAGGDPARVNSVASMFVSRVDALVDEAIGNRIDKARDAATRTALTSVMGQAAIANAKFAYHRFHELCRTRDWQALSAKGAHAQRLLWASTSTKNPRYRDVRYVEELIGPETVTTLTQATMDAFRQHGRTRATLEEHLADANQVLAFLKQVDISLADISFKLLENGLARFGEALHRLLAALDPFIVVARNQARTSG